jgi:uncharacterized protein involved in response to NO
LAAGLLWIAAFGLCAWHMAALFVAPRADGQHGCKEATIP